MSNTINENEKKYAGLETLRSFKENADKLYATQENVDEISSVLEEKANTLHTHDISDVINLQPTIDEINDDISQKSQVQMITSDSSNNTTEILSTLKIHKITQELYEEKLVNGTLEDNALYLTPDEEIDLSGYATIEQLNNKANVDHNHNEVYYTKTDIDIALENKASSTHNHEIDDVNRLQNILDNKASQNDLDALENIVNGKSDILHQHNIEDINELQPVLDTLGQNISIKANIQHSHDFSDITNLQPSLNEIEEAVSQKSQVQIITSNALEVLSTLKIHKIAQEEYDQMVSNGTLEDNAIYLTPEEEVDLSNYATKEDLNGKSDSDHNHNNVYYTKTEIDQSLVNKSDITHNHDNKYDFKDSANNALIEAKRYADDVTSKAANDVKNDLLNGAGTAYDTLKELGDLIDNNVDAIEALEIVASGKANVDHTHNDIYYTETEIDRQVTTINNSISTSLNEAKSYSDSNLNTAKNYTDNAVAQRTQVQIITWEVDD